MSRFPWCIGTVLLLALAGCDPSAKASASDRLAVSQDRLSRLHESCATTSDCADELRCFENVCRATAASVVGDFHAAVGARALANDEQEVAVTAYTAAVNRYESDRIEVPLEVLCGKGRALVGAGEDTEQAELAARALHECLRRAPVGAAVRAQALAGLAQLAGVGLDPELLARDELMTRYLTKEPARPASSAVQVKATGDGKTRARSYTELLETLQSEEVRAQLIPCWEAHWTATKQKTLTTTIRLRYYFFEGYEPSDDRDKIQVRSPEPAAGTPERCIFDAIGPLGEEFSKSRRGAGRWESDIILTLE